jgi:hypothetical protein
MVNERMGIKIKTIFFIEGEIEKKKKITKDLKKLK